MARTVVGVAANLCPVDAEGQKTFHSSVSCRFRREHSSSWWSPLVIPVGDESVVRDYVEMIDKLILNRRPKCSSSVLWREKKTIESEITI